MRISIISLFILALLPVAAFAEGGAGKKFRVGGYYGMGFINPKDLNDITTSFGTTPKMNTINSSTYYGGLVEFHFTPMIAVQARYKDMAANNKTDVGPFKGMGWEMSENQVEVLFEYFPVNNGKIYFGLGVGPIVPLYSHLTFNNGLGGKSQYDAEKNIGFVGQATVGFMMGQHFSVFLEAGYESLVSGDIKPATAPTMALLKVNSASKAAIDYSGPRADIGLAVHF